MQLQVAEACNGIRYLFPLVTLGLVAAFFYQGALWKRVVLFLSTIPITVLLNGLRIGLIGVSVEYWGQEMAEGILHDIEGFAMFGASFTVLMLEAWLLARVGGDRRPLRRVLGLTFPRPTPKGARIEHRPLPVPLVAAVALLAAALAALTLLPEREDVRPARKDLVDLPLALGEWKGQPVRVEDLFIDALKVTDHRMLDFAGPGGQVVNLWIAYYGSQRKGESAHSPASCLPGGGFQIESLGEYAVPGVSISGMPLTVNRSVMRMGNDRQLVWYWFQQRGRVITNEYLVKWYIFRDALLRNRTDGALVRLMMSVPDGRNVADGDAAAGIRAGLGEDCPAL